ncbi:unnamed protein product [Urochloa decumbens]|uniref:NB-ARC domain-containing protein n=1 Tax=Urochloa decumbens TaxID=240449 RepID=A0ABC9FTU8_9POAL
MAEGVVRLCTSVLGELRRVIEEDRKRQGRLKNGVEVIKNEMEMVLAMIVDYTEYRDRETTQEKLILQQLQELAYDIEDFVAALWVPGPSGALVLTATGMDPRPQYGDRIDEFRKILKNLQGQKRTEAKALFRSSQGGGDTDYHSDAMSATLAGSSASSSPPRYTPRKDLVGINKPIQDIIDLMSTANGGQHDAERKKLRVISIVGCRGIGKTALARAAYEDPRVFNKFDCVAWVEGSEISHSVDLLVNKVTKTLQTEAPTTTKSTNLFDILGHKRYLVFIDNVQQADVWRDTVDAFPLNDTGSRILVTTSVYSVAVACSSGSYVYRMQSLGQDESKDLFWRRVYGRPTKPANNLVTGSEGIFSKCGGLPLALTSIANHLSIKSNYLTKSCCEDVSKYLGRDYLSGNTTVSTFRQLRKVLVQCYDNLPDYDHRIYLLYLSIFPEGHKIKNKSLIRRLVAEGLVPKDGSKCFDVLVDRCTVDPVQDCGTVLKKCQVRGVVLEYITEKAVSKNFVTLIHKQERLRKVDSNVARVRRLSIQSSTKERYSDVEDKSAIRSLTIFKSDLFAFQSCKMLRLLDLENCEGLNKGTLDDICQLLLLKYLSLRKTGINELPSKINKLQHLQTLNIQDTQVKTLPMEVIMLPKLAYLFGKFELPKSPKDKWELEQFLTKKSELHTLSGFVIKNKQGIESTILMARKLKKVKVWYEATLDPAPAESRASVPALVSSNSAPAPAPNGTLAPAGVPSRASSPSCARSSFFTSTLQICASCLKGRKRVLPPDPNPVAHAFAPIRSNAGALDFPSQINLGDFISSLEKRFTTLDSVSIDSSRLCKEFLGSLKGPSTISSIKLRGQLDSLPDSITLNGLCNLTNLQLISTGLSSHDLSNLQILSCLEYLKLSEHRDGFWDGRFVVNKDGFESLQQLCFEAPKLPKLQFNEGAMRSLTSLQLICANPPITTYFSSSFQLQESIEGFLHLTHLNEVILHDSANEAKMEAWKTAANRHINRPCVKKQPKSNNSEE